MADNKWDKLSYTLQVGANERQLVILSNFEQVDDTWFDTGVYTITEADNRLGDLTIDLYADGDVKWLGSVNEFSSKELHKIAHHVTFHDFTDDDVF